MLVRIRRIAALAGVLALTACSSLPIAGSGGGGGRSVDYLNDDLASLLVAVDVPPSLEPVPGASTFSLDITTSGSGERHVKAALVETDAGDLAGTLPPPADQRNYYLFGFSDKDRQAIREAQAWGRSLPPGVGTVAVALSPGFCRTEDIDPTRTTVSVLAALPGATGLAPLLSNQPLSTLLAAAPIKDVPPCAGHSG